MARSRIGVVRTWLRDNEPFFKFSSFGLVAILGSAVAVFVAWKQAVVSNKQIEFAEAGLAVSKAQLVLTELQTKYAQSQFAPTFTFDSECLTGSPFGSLQVKSSREDIQGLQGRAVVFVEECLPGRPTKRIKVDGFYLDTARIDELAGNKQATFMAFQNVYLTASLKFMYPTEPAPVVTENAFTPTLVDMVKATMENKSRRVMNFVELTYFTQTREEVTDRFLMEFPCTHVRPLMVEPMYDGTVELANFKSSEGGYDMVALNRAVDALTNGGNEAGE